MTVAKWFGISEEGSKVSNAACREQKSSQPTPILKNGITLIIGPSGAGKSTLLRKISTDAKSHARIIDLPRLRLPNRPLVDCFPRSQLTDVLKLLGRVGLAEAWTYLRTPMELSDGQRWRFRLAIAIHKTKKSKTQSILIADEFAALLDRVTALVVARALRKLVDANPSITIVCATCHEDLIQALAPDQIVRCDFGKIEVETPHRLGHLR